MKSIPWYAVGSYYFLIEKYVDAKLYFCKATTIDAGFGAAWIGYAHSFEMDSEHDQAITAYNQAAKFLQGYFFI
jgi:anaphase-promoting complex subunit 6